MWEGIPYARLSIPSTDALQGEECRLFSGTSAGRGDHRPSGEDTGGRAAARQATLTSPASSLSSPAGSTGPTAAAETATSTGPPAGGHPPPRPGAVRHAVGGRVRVDRSQTDSSTGEEGEHTLFVYIPEDPPEED